MAGVDHRPNVKPDDETAEIAARNSRIGLVLFALYLMLYGAYVLVNAFAPQVMERTPLAGVNLAVLSGFGLIIAAFVLALLYGWLCRSVPARNDHLETDLR